jgi:hypothetical protein
MIIWISSYPKSGNTWVRSFIYTLLYSKNLKPDLNKISFIQQYPVKKHFKNLVKNFNNFSEVSANWIKSQNLINLDKKIKFLKTHHVMCALKGNKFTNLNNSLAAIHVVRDPRNVITSIKNHYSKENYNSAYEFLIDENHCIDVENITHQNIKKEEILNTLISSWGNHYNSWKNFPKNYLLIKYEDLINDPKNTFFQLKRYLEKILEINISDYDVEKSIESNNFLNLKTVEQNEGFEESALDKFNKRKNFFNLGPENKWEKLLSEKIRKKIEIKFFKEMKDLKYL